MEHIAGSVTCKSRACPRHVRRVVELVAVPSCCTDKQQVAESSVGKFTEVKAGTFGSLDSCVSVHGRDDLPLSPPPHLWVPFDSVHSSPAWVIGVGRYDGADSETCSLSCSASRDLTGVGTMKHSVFRSNHKSKATSVSHGEFLERNWPAVSLPSRPPNKHFPIPDGHPGQPRQSMATAEQSTIARAASNAAP
jgi:hypothetical protein